MNTDKIYCPICENVCSPEAAKCPGCGHPLRAPRFDAKRIRKWVIVGALLMLCAWRLLDAIADNRAEWRSVGEMMNR